MKNKIINNHCKWKENVKKILKIIFSFNHNWGFKTLILSAVVVPFTSSFHKRCFIASSSFYPSSPLFYFLIIDIHSLLHLFKAFNFSHISSSPSSSPHLSSLISSLHLPLYPPHNLSSSPLHPSYVHFFSSCPYPFTSYILLIILLILYFIFTLDKDLLLLFALFFNEKFH